METRSSTLAETYTLSLGQRDRRLGIFLAIFFIAISGTFLWQMFIDEFHLLFVAFVVYWIFGVVRNFMRFVRGPKEITLQGNESVHFCDWFNRTSVVQIAQIQSIEVEKFTLVIKTEVRDYYTFSGFDDLHRFVGDVTRTNPLTLVKGI